jgi:phosphate transport system protein
MERHFDEELQNLREKLLKMSSLVEQALHMSRKALVNKDRKMALQVIDADNNVNALEIEIDDICIKLFALRQPQARDLRFISSALKINNDLERIADLAVNIAERVLDLLKLSSMPPIFEIPDMAEIVQKMLKNSINAFVFKDSGLARSVCKRDDVVDELNLQIFKKYLALMLKEQRKIEGSLDLIFIAKYLERVGDLSTNICEDIIYMIDGKIIKHHQEK